jgi:hypothetical protein
MNKRSILSCVSLPDIFTSVNGILGFIAIYAVMIGYPILAARFVFICIFFDSFDGFLARRNNNCANFGKSFDSLADIISFGIVPSIIFIGYSKNTILALILGTIYDDRLGGLLWTSNNPWSNIYHPTFSWGYSILFIFCPNCFNFVSFYIKF